MSDITKQSLSELVKNIKEKKLSSKEACAPNVSQHTVGPPQGRGGQGVLQKVP